MIDTNTVFFYYFKYISKWFKHSTITHQKYFAGSIFCYTFTCQYAETSLRKYSLIFEQELIGTIISKFKHAFVFTYANKGTKDEY